MLAKAIAALIRRTLAAEIELEEAGADPRTLDDRCWRQKGDKPFGVIISDAGRAAIAADEALQAEATAQADDVAIENDGTSPNNL